MKKLMLISLFPFCSMANDAFDSSKLAGTERIFWVNSNTEKAVVYGEFENFHNLKSLISSIISTDNSQPYTKEKYCSFDSLVFVDSNKSEIIQFKIDGEHVFYNGYAFADSNSKLSDFVKINQHRISQGEALHSKAIKLNIKNYAAKCL
ncbi:hypothetical protein [Pseudoalteromonas xiamenensis]